MSDLTEERVKREAGEYDLDVVFRLSIRGAGLTNVSVLALCTNVAIIDLDDNHVDTLAPFSELHALQVLKLNNNSISSLAGFRAPSLEALHLAGNRIAKLEDLADLEHLAALRELSLSRPDGTDFNSVVKVDGYFERVKELCPLLRTLDGEQVQLRNMVQEAILSGIGDDKPVSIPRRSRWLKEYVSQGSEKDRSLEEKVDELCVPWREELTSAREAVADADKLLQERPAS